MSSAASDGLKHRYVADIQRARIVSATFEVCARRGAANITVAHIVAQAGVSRRTFYELFDDSESCLLIALEEAVALAALPVREAFEASDGWAERIRASLVALLQFLEREPAIGRMLIVESFASGQRALERRSRALEPVVEAVDAGRGQVKKGVGPSPMTAEAVVGSVLFVLHQRMIEPEGDSLVELVNPLMSLIVQPYLGAAASRAELARPASAPAHLSGARRDSLGGLDIRLTYRTMRVLDTIATQPGASNRQIGRVAGVDDPGQISKLLGRLQRAGLIVNADAGAPKGSANAWKLTPKGVEVESAIAFNETHQHASANSAATSGSATS